MLIPILLFLSLLNTSLGQKYSNKNASDLGLTIENIGKLSTSNSETLISIILQLPDIQNNLGQFTTSEKARIRKCSRLYSAGITSYSSTHSKIISGLISTDREKISEYLNSRRQVLKPYIIDDFGKTRNKRGIWSMLGGSLLTLAFGGIAEYQMYKLKTHIEDNSKEIDKLKIDLVSEQQNRLKLRKDIIGLIKADRETLKNYTEIMSCVDLPFMLKNSKESKFWRNSKIIDDVLSGPLEGKNKLALTPKIIDPEILQKIIHQHPQLNNTIFKNNPHLLYTTSSISLLSIDTNLTQAHFVLYIPVVNVKDNLHDLYQTVQVGIHVKNNTCGYFNLPRHVFVKNDRYYDVQLAECKQNNALYICSTNSIQNASSCIQADKITCPLKHTTCISPCQFKLCKQGILFRENSEKDAYTLDNKGYMSEINLKESHSQFVPWKGHSAIQVCNTRLESPATQYPPVEVTNFTINFNDLTIIDPEQLSKIFTHLSSKYNTTLQMVMNPIFSKHVENTKSSSWKLQYINTAMIILLFILIVYVYHRLGVLCYNCIDCRNCKSNYGRSLPGNGQPDIDSESEDELSNTQLHGINRDDCESEEYARLEEKSKSN